MDVLKYATGDSGEIKGTVTASTATFTAPVAGTDTINGLAAGDGITLGNGTYAAIASTTIPTTNTLTLTADLDAAIVKIGASFFFVYETAVGSTTTLGTCEAIDITGITATNYTMTAAGVVTFS